MTHRPFLPPLYCHEDDASWIHHIPPSRALNTKAASASLPAPSCHLPSPPAPKEARHSRLFQRRKGMPLRDIPFLLFLSAWRPDTPFYVLFPNVGKSLCRIRHFKRPPSHFPKETPARYRYQRLATRIRAMALVSASSARWTSVSGLGSARRSSARALACSALSTSMSEASSAASARMVTLLSAI